MRRSAESLRNARDCILEVYTARSGAREGIRSREELISLMDRDIFITPTQAREYGLIDEIVGAGAEVADPAAFVAAAGSRIRLTQAMREGYQSHVAGQRPRRPGRNRRSASWHGSGCWSDFKPAHPPILRNRGLCPYDPLGPAGAVPSQGWHTRKHAR